MMRNTYQRHAVVIASVLVGFIAVGVASGLTYIGWIIYKHAGKTPHEFYVKLGDFILQLAVVIIIGALIKLAVDWGADQRRRHTERVEKRMDFMRRVRAVHVTVEYARTLLNAHRSPKSFGEQGRRLMQLRPEVEEIAEDLKASPSLFSDQDVILEGLEGIVVYLNKGTKEYIRAHRHVDSDFKAGKSLEDTIKEQKMSWLRDFMRGGNAFEEGYVQNLSKSKNNMRAEVYGA